MGLKPPSCGFVLFFMKKPHLLLHQSVVSSSWKVLLRWGMRWEVDKLLHFCNIESLVNARIRQHKNYAQGMGKGETQTQAGGISKHLGPQKHQYILPYIRKLQHVDLDDIRWWMQAKENDKLSTTSNGSILSLADCAHHLHRWETPCLKASHRLIWIVATAHAILLVPISLLSAHTGGHKIFIK